MSELSTMSVHTLTEKLEKAERELAVAVIENADLRERLSSLESLYRARDKDCAAKEAELERVHGILKAAQSRSDWGCSACEMYQGVADALASPAAEPVSKTEELLDELQSLYDTDGLYVKDEDGNREPVILLGDALAMVEHVMGKTQPAPVADRDRDYNGSLKAIAEHIGADPRETGYACERNLNGKTVGYRCAACICEEVEADPRQLDIEDQIKEAGHE